MRLATTLAPALHALRVHRLRTGLGLLGICFGVAAVVLILAFGLAGQARLDAEIRGLGSDIVVVLPGATQMQGAWIASRSAATVTEADAEAIAREVPGIAAAAPTMGGSAQVIAGNRNRTATVRGVTPALFEARPWAVKNGRPLADEDVRSSAKVALLGYGIARNLFGDEDPTGQSIRIKKMPFTVIGTLEEKGHTGGDDLDDQVFIPLSTARKRVHGFFLGNPSAVGGITLRISEEADMGRASDAVRSLLRERHRLDASAPDDFILRDIAAAKRAQARSAWLTTIMLSGAASISLLVGGIGIMNIMLVSVSERRQEIGLRMAIGATRREIAQQFLIEAGLLALFGSAVGVALALGVATMLGAGLVLKDPETIVAILTVIGAATLITTTSAMYPARRAARQDPAEALSL